MGSELTVEVRQRAARLGEKDATAGIHLPKPAQACEVEHQTSSQGNALAIVARPGSPHRQGNTMAGTGPSHGEDLFDGCRLHRELG